jgi:ketosteroid isomerase-like protein
MSAEANKRTALEFLEALARGELERAKAMMTEDATWQSPPSLAGGPFRGRDAIFGTYIAIDDELFETGTRSYDFEILNAIAEGDSVAIEMRHVDKAMDGSGYDSQYHMLYRFRDGLIFEVKEYFDSLFMHREFERQGLSFPQGDPPLR